jgi:putative holliday junction resolvase
VTPSPQSKPRNRCALGFDYGTKHIGVAVGQTVTATASPLAIVTGRNGKPDWARIEALVSEWQPDILVVGEPLNMDGSEQSMTEAARRFGRQLHGRFGLPVELADERLSTVEARATQARTGRLGEPDHPQAARVILETWLTENST